MTWHTSATHMFLNTYNVYTITFFLIIRKDFIYTSAFKYFRNAFHKNTIIIYGFISIFYKTHCLFLYHIEQYIVPTTHFSDLRLNKDVYLLLGIFFGQ